MWKGLTCQIPILYLFLTQLFQKLNESNITYCVLHSYDQIPQNVKSDIDIAIDKQGINKLDSIINKVSKNNGAKLIQKLHYDVPLCYYYIIAYNSEIEPPYFIQLDFYQDNLGIGVIEYQQQLYSKIVRNTGFFNIPEPSKEIVYLIIKRIMKQNLKPDEKDFILKTYCEN